MSWTSEWAKQSSGGHDLQRLRCGWQLVKHARGRKMFQTGQNAESPPRFGRSPFPRRAAQPPLFHSCKASLPRMTTSPISHSPVRPLLEDSVWSPAREFAGHVLASSGSLATSAGGLVKPSRHSYWTFRSFPSTCRMPSSSAWLGLAQLGKAAVVSNLTIEAEITR